MGKFVLSEGGLREREKEREREKREGKKRAVTVSEEFQRVLIRKVSPVSVKRTIKRTSLGLPRRDPLLLDFLEFLVPNLFFCYLTLSLSLSLSHKISQDPSNRKEKKERNEMELDKIYYYYYYYNYYNSNNYNNNNNINKWAAVATDI